MIVEIGGCMYMQLQTILMLVACTCTSLEPFLGRSLFTIRSSYNFFDGGYMYLLAGCISLQTHLLIYPKR
jgi:hypothetical protein